MGVLRRRHHYWLPALLLTAFTLLLFSSAASVISRSRTTRASSQPSVGVAAELVKSRMEEKAGDEKRWRSRRPGSWPPSCKSKCGWCNPCEPVHVPVQPGFIIRLEYYPEAWRCKCGSKLFMP
ncbi:hypothetical protein PIB30_051165 [Stylosanthes scabra]|uniref:Epidermal patterning factor-like protein n=1 Tax=Stylosanthes scabra TaxID=79078 RepID=A0ABU6THN9_9FABA|nr:hypothetical protein [Stylosanthes scabra]